MTVRSSGTSDSTEDRNRKEFTASFTRFWMMFVPALLIAIALVFFGFQYYVQGQRIALTARNGGGKIPDDFPPTWLFYVLPWTVAAVIVIFYIGVYHHQSRRRIFVTPQYLEVHRGGDISRSLWRDISLTPPRADKKSFRSALVSNGKYYERVYEFFYPEFDLFVDVVTAAKKHSRENLTT